jgi:hypothetical protein
MIALSLLIPCRLGLTFAHSLGIDRALGVAVLRVRTPKHIGTQDGEHCLC